MACELSEKTWKLGFTTGHGQKPRERNVPARHQERILDEIAQAKRRLGLPETAPVVSCYEAGRDGFWLHRFLLAQGITNQVVDPSAIEVNRRRRRAKSDGLDVRKLVTMLIRYHQGEDKVWQVLNVPSVDAEDQRHLHRDLETLKQERASPTHRIKGLLSSQGIQVPSLSKLPEQLGAMRFWDGSPIPPGLCQRVLRVYAHHTFLSEQIAAVDAQRRALLRTSQGVSIDKIRQLMLLKGIGMNGSWLLVMEFFAWREFKNRREVGALAGFTPTPYQSPQRLVPAPYLWRAARGTPAEVVSRIDLHPLTQRWREVKTTRHIAAGVFQGGCVPAGPALKWLLKCLSTAGRCRP